MSNVLGGGGGREGFRHMLGHLGPAAKVWLDDMNAHPYEYNAENLETLDRSVQEELDRHDSKAVEQQRDGLLMALLNGKKSAPALV